MGTTLWVVLHWASSWTSLWVSSNSLYSVIILWFEVISAVRNFLASIYIFPIYCQTYKTSNTEITAWVIKQTNLPGHRWQTLNQGHGHIPFWIIILCHNYTSHIFSYRLYGTKLGNKFLMSGTAYWEWLSPAPLHFCQMATSLSSSTSTGCQLFSLAGQWITTAHQQHSVNVICMK